jgi:hypothetical protein
MDHRGKAGVCFAGSHRDAFEFLELSEAVLDEVAPFAGVFVDLAWRSAVGMLRDDDLGAAPVHLFDDPVHIKRFVGQNGAEFVACDQLGDADRIVALTGQQYKVDEVAQGVCQRQNLAGDPAARLPYCLAFSPPFAPCP